VVSDQAQNPDEFVSQEEQDAAANPSVGEGSPLTAPARRPKVGLLDRLRPTPAELQE
jgi:hypothetical protein